MKLFELLTAAIKKVVEAKECIRNTRILVGMSRLCQNVKEQMDSKI